MKVGKIHDHHNPHNDGCPQNNSLLLAQDCNCKLKEKRERKPDIINRAAVRKRLLGLANAKSTKVYTQVKPSTLNELSMALERAIKNLADNAPKVGKTI